MKSRLVTFNCNLLLALMILLTACETTKDPKKPETAEKTSDKKKKKEKELSTAALFLETSAQATGANSAPIYRENPIYVPVEAQPFLTFANIEEATVADYMGGFVIQFKFDAHGAFVFDTITSANKGRRIAVFSKFPEPRWLAAPQITKRNATGILSFTPDATREESERFVRGLNAAIKKYRKKEPF
jgi:preprotein translocase subunit SecD